MLLDYRQPVVGIIDVVPGLQQRPLALLDDVTLGVVGVRPDAVVGHAVGTAGLVAGHRAVAIGIVGVGCPSIMGKLVRVVETECPQTAVDGLARHSVGVVVGVDVAGQYRTTAVLVVNAGQSLGVVVGIHAGADHRGPGQIAVPGDRG